ESARARRPTLENDQTGQKPPTAAERLKCRRENRDPIPSPPVRRLMSSHDGWTLEASQRCQDDMTAAGRGKTKPLPAFRREGLFPDQRNRFYAQTVSSWVSRFVFFVG